MTKTKSPQKRAKLPNHGFLSSNQRTAYFLAPNPEMPTSGELESGDPLFFTPPPPPPPINMGMPEDII